MAGTGVERVAVPNGRVALSRLGLGAAPLGGLYGPLPGDPSLALLRAAADAGVRHVDTAPLYGYGQSERLVGRALAELGHLDPPMALSTKVGRLVAPADRREEGDIFLGAPPGRATFDFSADGVRRSFEASLERLGVDRVDVLLVHDPDDHLDQAIREALPAAAALRDAGLASAIGAGMNDAAALHRIVVEADVDVVLVAGQLSLLDRSAATALLPACAERGVGVVVGGVFSSGILADPVARPVHGYRPAPPEVRARALAMAAACARHGVPLRAAALQLPFRYPDVTSVLVGAADAGELEDAVTGLGVAVGAALWDELDAIAVAPVDTLEGT